MAELAVFGSGNPADIEEYFQAGADRFFIALSGDLKRELHALRAAGRLQDDGRVGVAQLEWVDGATLVESLPRDWRVPCVMSKFFVPHDAGCDVMTIPAAWTEPGDFPEKDVVRALKERICHVYVPLGAEWAPGDDGYHLGLRELARESNEHPEWGQMDETDLRSLASAGSVSIGGGLSPRDFPWLASVVPAATTGLFWICDDAFAPGKELLPTNVPAPKAHILEMLKLARMAGFGA